MKRPMIIGLTGPMGVGKTTVAELLCKYAGFSSIAFGDLLRAQICTSFPTVDASLFTRRDLKDAPTDQLALQRCVSLEFTGAVMTYFRKEYGDADLLDRMAQLRSPREVMKFWAEQYRKPMYGDNYFTRAVTSKVYLEQSHHQLRHVIHDVRFPVEAAAVRSLGGQIWQIESPTIEALSGDPTETDGAKFNPELIINNRSDLRYLQSLVLGHFVMKETGLLWTDLVDMGQVHALVRAA